MAPSLSPAEYHSRGHVSARTDSFAYGIMTLELLTGLHPIVARDLVDDSLFEDLPTRIQQHHDGTAELPAVSMSMAGGKSAFGDEKREKGLKNYSRS